MLVYKTKLNTEGFCDSSSFKVGSMMKSVISSDKHMLNQRENL